MKNRGTILIVDDDENFRGILAEILQKEGHEVLQAEVVAIAIEKLTLDGLIDLLVTDIKMPGRSGYDLVREAASIRPGLPVVVLTAYGSIKGAEEAMRIGAVNYVTKPFDRRELIAIVSESLRCSKEVTQRQREESEDEPVFASVAMEKVVPIAERAARSEATVLITGETGVGKEVVAELVHRGSGRHPFVKVNCSAIPENLVESELFGHRKGAFTGATADRRGKFAEAHGGTILLDEIGDLDTKLQAKLLRVLEEKIVDILGGGREEVDVRVIAATNRIPEHLVAEGKMRRDLYFRLNVIRIDIPPLRQRPEDIEPLARRFLQRASEGFSLKIDPEVFAMLRRYDWPGNVRELKNLCQRLVILRRSDRIDVTDLPDYIRWGGAVSPLAPALVLESSNPGATLHELEKSIILQALEKNGWNRSAAARYLGIPRHVLLYRMKKFGIDRE